MIWIYLKTFVSRYKLVVLFAALAFVALSACVTYFLDFKIKETRLRQLYQSSDAISKSISSDLSSYIVQSQTIAEYFKHSTPASIDSIYMATRQSLASSFGEVEYGQRTLEHSFTSNIALITIADESEVMITSMFEENEVLSAFRHIYQDRIKFQKKFYDYTEWFILDPFQVGTTDQYYIPICIKGSGRLTEAWAGRLRLPAGVSSAGSGLSATMCILYPWSQVWQTIKKESDSKQILTAIMGYDGAMVYGQANAHLLRDPAAMHNQIKLPYKKWMLATKFAAGGDPSVIEVLKEGYFLYLIALTGVMIACVIIFIQYRHNYELHMRTEMILTNIHDTAWSMTVEGFKLTWISSAIKYLNGRQPSEMHDYTIFDIVNAETSSEFCNTVNQRIVAANQAGQTGNINFTVEGLAKHIHGYEVWVEISSIIVYKNGRYSEIHGISRRIDERKEVQALMLKQHQELTDANQTKSMLFSIIAHDLKNPFSALLNIAEVLSTHYVKMDKEQLGRSVGIILNSAHHIYVLLENLLMWSRSQTDSITYNPVKANLWSLAKRTLNVLEAQALNKNIRLRLLPPGPADESDQTFTVFADEDMISTVFRNITTNALKFSREHSDIDIDIQRYPQDTRYLMVSIEDHGVGMPAEAVENLFQVSTITSKRGTKDEVGTGLGLIIVKDFIERHNSRIWATSQEGTGTTFFFTLLSWKEHREHLMFN